MAGEVRFTPTVDDWVAANRLWYRRSRFRRWSGWFGLAILIFAAGDVVIDLFSRGMSVLAIAADMGWLVVAALILLALPLLNAWLLPRQIRRQFAQRPSMADEISCRWDDERLFMSVRTGTTDQPWAELHRQLRDDCSFAFLMTDRLMLLVPRRVLTDAQASDLAATADRFGPPIG